MTIDGSYYTEEQRRTLIRAWLDEAQDTGRLVADPLSNSTVRAVHDLYLEMNPDHPIARNAFGAVVNLWLPQAVRGSGGTWIRPGIKIVPAS